MGIEDGIGSANAQQESLEKLQLPDSIIVTSASTIKVNTVRKVLQELFPKRNFNVVGVKASSEINEQPVGEEAEQGALNRIRNAEAAVEGSEPGVPRAFVSIENGIFKIAEGGWEDKAVAVIKLPDGKIFSEISPRGVQFPNEAVQATLAKAGGFKDHTVGSVIAEMYAAKGQQIDKQDPHRALTGGTFTREEQMITAIKGALTKAAGIS